MQITDTNRFRVVFNALGLQPYGTGVQTYVTELLKALVGEVNADVVAVVHSDADDERSANIEAKPRSAARGLPPRLS